MDFKADYDIACEVFHFILLDKLYLLWNWFKLYTKCGQLDYCFRYYLTYLKLFFEDNFLDDDAIFFSSDLTFLSNFLISCSAGRFSGFIPLFASSPLTSWLFLTCSFVILCSPYKSSFLTLKFVISVARFFAVMVIVGKKSASARFLGICIV